MVKPRALSLHVGVNSLDPKHYAGWKGELKSCEFDADDMAGIAKSMGMKAKVLRTKAATRAAVLAALKDAGKQLKAGDFFFLSFSGYGSQVEDVSGDEMDRKDDSWCLHDAQVIDDEIYAEISRWAVGVRVLVLLDSSPSGSVPRPHMPEPDPPPAGLRARLVSPLIAEKVYLLNEKLYDALQKSVKVTGVPAPGPAVIVIEGCQHNQAAFEGKDNGVFTERLLHLWNQGSYQGSYARLFAMLVARMPSTQTPMLRTYGDVAGFLTQAPFTP